MISNLSLYRPTEVKVAQTLHEFKTAKESISFCYAMGGTYKFKSKTIDKEGQLQVLDKEMAIPDLYISKEFDVILFSEYGVKNANDGVNLISLPGWFARGDKGSYLDSFMGRYYGITRDANQYSAGTPEEVSLSFSKPAVLLGTPTDDAFSHFIFETFAKLSALDADIIESYVFIVSKHIKSYQKEMLVRAGIAEDRIVTRTSIGSGPIQFKELILIKWPSHNNSWTAPRALHYLIDFFSKKYSGDPNELPKAKIYSSDRHEAYQGKLYYLDRDDERRAFRALTNEKELKDQLAVRDFAIRTPGSMNFSEKYNMLSTCKGLVGQYGGGLQLCFLAPFGTKIIVIQSELFKRQHIDFMAGILGFEVVNVPADQDDEEAHANASVKVAVDVALQALSKLGIY